MRVLIYNGDATSACRAIAASMINTPSPRLLLTGTKELVTNLESAGSLVEKAPWQPWYAEKGSGKAPAGYVTTYSVPGKTFPSKGPDASFLTIRLAGHMVPTFQPKLLSPSSRASSGARRSRRRGAWRSHQHARRKSTGPSPRRRDETHGAAMHRRDAATA